MLLDRAVDHLSLHGHLVHVAVGLVRAQVLLAAGVAQLEELIARSDTDLADPAIVVHGSPGRHFQSSPSCTLISRRCTPTAACASTSTFAVMTPCLLLTERNRRYALL